RKLACARWPSEFEVWRQCLLAELTEAAYRTTLKYRTQRSSLELEMDLYQAFCRVLDDVGRNFSSDDIEVLIKARIVHLVGRVPSYYLNLVNWGSSGE